MVYNSASQNDIELIYFYITTLSIMANTNQIKNSIYKKTDDPLYQLKNIPIYVFLNVVHKNINVFLSLSIRTFILIHAKIMSLDT